MVLMPVVAVVVAGMDVCVSIRAASCFPPQDVAKSSDHPDGH
jgi:hypothetical protein